MIGLWTRVHPEQATDREPKEQRHTLDYAPAPEHHRKRAWLKRITLTIFFIAAGVFAIALVRRAVSGWQLLREQQAMMSHLAPAGSVIWTSEPKTKRIIPVVFLHGRVRSDGVARLISVSATRNERAEALLSCHTLPLRRLWDRPGGLAAWFGSQTVAVEKLYAGQPDPNDPSHFTIGYELDDMKGTIDGWLMNDDSVKLEVRDGPLRDR